MSQTLLLTNKGPQPPSPLDARTTVTGHNDIEWDVPQNCYAIVFINNGVDSSGSSKYKLHSSDVFLVNHGGTQKRIAQTTWNQVARSQPSQNFTIAFSYWYVLFCQDRTGTWSMCIYQGKKDAAEQNEDNDPCIDNNGDSDAECVEIFGVSDNGEATSRFNFIYPESLGGEVETYGQLVELLLSGRGGGLAQADHETGTNWGGILNDLQSNRFPSRALMAFHAFNKPRIIVRR